MSRCKRVGKRIPYLNSETCHMIKLCVTAQDGAKTRHPHDSMDLLRISVQFPHTLRTLLEGEGGGGDEVQ